MIEFDHVSKRYDTRFVQTHALQDVSFQIRKGEFVSITGPSGSGKTTLLNVAGLLDRHESGRYLFDGEDVSALSERERAALRNRRIGFVFQTFNLISDHTLYENIEIPLIYRKVPAAARRRKIEEALQMMGLAARSGHYPPQLSGGQQQRVAIARALVGEPSVLFADEPTGNLDSEMSSQVLDIIAGINTSGTTIVLVTHDPRLASRAQREIQILDGRLTRIVEHSARPLATALSG